MAGNKLSPAIEYSFIKYLLCLTLLSVHTNRNKFPNVKVTVISQCDLKQMTWAVQKCSNLRNNLQIVCRPVFFSKFRKKRCTGKSVNEFGLLQVFSEDTFTPKLQLSEPSKWRKESLSTGSLSVIPGVVRARDIHRRSEKERKYKSLSLSFDFCYILCE